MIFLYYILLACLLGTYCLVLMKVGRTMKTLTPLLGWMIGIGFFMIAPLTVLTLNGGFKQPSIFGVNGTWDEVNLSSQLYLRPYLMIWMCLMLTLAAAYISRLDLPEGEGYSQISRPQLRRILLATMVISAVDWAIMVWLQGGISELLISNWYTRNADVAERAGFLYVAYARVSLVNQMLFTAAAALFSNLALKDRKTPWKFTSLILFFFLLELIISGNRIFLALYLLAFLTSAWSYGRKKIMVALVLSSPVLALAFSLWAAVRSDFGKASDDSQASKAYELDVGNTTVTHLMGVTEGSAIMLLMHFINDFGAKFDYLYGGTYARPFTLVIPRSICPVRPPDMTTLAAQLYEPGESTSLGSTAMGEAYANFGAVSICVLPLLTFFAAWCSRRLCVNADKHNLMSTVSFIMFIGFVRFPFAENAITWVATLFMIWLFRLDQRLVRHDFRRGAMLLGTHGPSPDPSPLAGA